MHFQLKSPFQPSGDQPQAIAQLVRGLKNGQKHQTLLGVTGSGKTFSIAKVIQKIQKPTLVIAHNKTLAAQLTQEYRQFFPQNRVEYFVSYYDYYQPEAYIPSTDTYIEKEAQINEEIDRLRHSATQALLTRRDTIVVASVSCIYNIGSPALYQATSLELKLGQKVERQELIRQLVKMYYLRRPSDTLRGTFRAVGNLVEIKSPDSDNFYRLRLAGSQISQIEEIDGLTREVLAQRDQIRIFPAKHYVTDAGNFSQALANIGQELSVQAAKLKSQGKLLEAERLIRRTNYDLEMIREVGYCNGIENYSRYFDNRQPGEPAYTLLDYFPSDFLLVIDESHVTVPQIQGMFSGDRSRKETLIEHGFRLASALDNRPLNFSEFEQKMPQTIYTSATPGPYELEKSSQVVEQIVRPTGLVDPKIMIRPIANQIKDLQAEIKKRLAKNQRVLVTTLTKRQAEDLSDYLKQRNYQVEYLHSGVDTLARIEVLTRLRKGEIDIVVGVNLLREGLDLPEVSLVAILDADKEGFLRSQTSLIQTIGRAARNLDGQVILYADNLTGSIGRALKETGRRRQRQLEYNREHDITPQTIQKNISDITETLELRSRQKGKKLLQLEQYQLKNSQQLENLLSEKRQEMKQAARQLEFELAALLRDEIQELERLKRRERSETGRVYQPERTDR